MNEWRRRNRRYRARTPGRLPAWAIVAICFGAAVLAAVIVGNLLHFWLDEETMNRLTEGTPEPEETQPVPERAVPSVKAYPFVLGDPTGSLTAGEDGQPPAALSVSLNTPDGTLLYTSQAAEHYGIQGDEDVERTENMTELLQTVTYVCGVFYPQAFTGEDGSLYYPTAAEEAVLLREFARSGGAELLLVGLPLDAAHLTDTQDYLDLVKEALGSTTLALAVPFSVAVSERGWELLPLLREHADLLALDLQGSDPAAAGSMLLDANYYLVQHQMRLLLSSDQEAFISIAEATLTDVQILTAPPAPDPGETGGDGTDTGEAPDTGAVG